jgi:hypothetical protein
MEFKALANEYNVGCVPRTFYIRRIGKTVNIVSNDVGFLAIGFQKKESANFSLAEPS